MHGYRFRLPSAGFCWGLCGVVLSGLWIISWSNEATGATLEKRNQTDAPATSDYVPRRPTPAPDAEPVPLPESAAPPVPQPPPLAPHLGPVPVPPGGPPVGPPPPGAICRPVPTVAEPVAALGVTVTWPAEGGGVLVLDVAPFSPAAYAGLVRGDRILAINHQLISTPKILVGYIRHKLPGERIWIAYWRYGAIQSTNTILNLKEAIPGAHPEAQPVPIWQASRRARQPAPEKHDVVLAESILR
jgi:hypothetical protein